MMIEATSTARKLTSSDAKRSLSHTVSLPRLPAHRLPQGAREMEETAAGGVVNSITTKTDSRTPVAAVSEDVVGRIIRWLQTQP